MIEPVFERLAEEKGPHGGRNGAGFAKVDIDVGMGRNLASEWGIRATPTFMFFLGDKKVCSTFVNIRKLILIMLRLTN